MKRLLWVVAVMMPLLSVARTDTAAVFQHLALGRDANGEKVMFNFTPIGNGVKELRLSCDDSRKIAVLNREAMAVYDLQTMKRTAFLEISPTARIAGFFDEGFLVLKDKAKLLSTDFSQPHFYSYKGEEIWSSKKEAFLNFYMNNVLVCAESRSNDGKYIAFDIPTGRELWRKTIPGYEPYLLSVPYISDNDSANVYLIGNMLMRLDMRKGDMLTYPFRAGADISGLRLMVSSSPFNGGVSLGVLFKSDKAPDVIGLHSNWLERGDSLFIADADNLYCFNRNLSCLWKTALPKGMGSRSEIKISGNRILLLNYGVGFARRGMCEYGQPFAASYDVTDGRQLSVTLPDIKKPLVGGVYADDGRVYWQTRKDFFHSAEGDTVAYKIKFKAKSSFGWSKDVRKYVVYDSVCIVRDGALQSIKTDGRQLVVEVYGKDVNIVGLDGQVTVIPADEAYFKDVSEYVFSTNRIEGKPTHFVTVDPASGKIKYTFYLKGAVHQFDDGDILVLSEQGIGYRKNEP